MKQNESTFTGHDSKGRFTKGNSCSTGRKVTELRQAMLSVVTTEDVKQIVSVVIAKAKEGDMSCISFLFDRCIGKAMPSQEFELYTHEYDRADWSPKKHSAFDMDAWEEKDQIRPIKTKY